VSTLIDTAQALMTLIGPLRRAPAKPGEKAEVGVWGDVSVRLPNHVAHWEEGEMVSVHVRWLPSSEEDIHGCWEVLSLSRIKENERAVSPDVNPGSAPTSPPAHHRGYAAFSFGNKVNTSEATMRASQAKPDLSAVTSHIYAAPRPVKRPAKGMTSVVPKPGAELALSPDSVSTGMAMDGRIDEDLMDDDIPF